MSKLTIDLGILSVDKQEAAKTLVIAAAKAKAEAEFKVALAKAEAEAEAKAEAETFAKSPEGLAEAQAEAKEAERLKNFRKKLFDVEDQYDCYVVNGQVGQKKFYRVFSNLASAKKFSKDVLSIGGRIYTHEPISCKIK